MGTKSFVLLLSFFIVLSSLTYAVEPVNMIGDGGPLMNWVIVGPFPTELHPEEKGTPPVQGYDYDFLTVLGGETKAVLSEEAKVGYRDEKGAAKTAVTKVVVANDRGFVDLRKAFAVGGRDAYAYCVVQAPADMTVTCGMGINDFGKVWVNGAVVHSDRALVMTEPWSFSFPVTLRKGRNDVLVKVEDVGGMAWEFIMELHPEKSPVLAARRRITEIEAFQNCKIFPKGGDEEYLIEKGPFPQFVWEWPTLVQQAVGDVPLKVRWFNSRLEEVSSATEPGRYAAVVEGTSASGIHVRRALTFFCCPDGWNLWTTQWKTTVEYPQNSPFDPAAFEQRKAQIGSWIGDQISMTLTQKQCGVSILAALFELKQLGTDLSPLEDPQIRNAEFHLALKRKLLGAESRYPVLKPAQSIPNAPAPVLRPGTCKDANMKPGVEDEIRKVCRTWYDEVKVPFVTLVARNGVIIYHEASVNPEQPELALDTPTWIASITKTLTALTFASFLDQGIIQLDDPVGTYLPDFPTQGDKMLTLRHCLTHTSGLKKHGSWGGLENPWLDNVVANGLENLAPGKRYQYNGDGYNLAGKVMEFVSGKSMQRLMSENLFAPLGIKTLFVKDLGGGAKLNAYELGSVGQLLLNRGAYGDKRLFSETTMEKLLPKLLSETYPGIIGDTQYGIGLTWQAVQEWQVKKMGRKGEKLLGPHTLGHGSATGCILRADPDNGLVIAQVRNKQTIEKDERNFFKLLQVVCEHLQK